MHEKRNRRAGSTEGPAGERRALLIGVRETPDLSEDAALASRYPRLDFVETDVALVGDALRHSGYVVDTECERTGYSPVLGRVSRFFQACEPGDTAFLYISCHGETIQGHDHLVLSDSQPGPALPDGTRAPLPATLLRADASELLSALPPGVTAVVCLDTCRTPASTPAGDLDRILVPGDRELFLMHSCGPGQRSYADRVQGSWFARSLARSLSWTTPPTTFHDVVLHTNELLRACAEPHPQIPPPSIQTVRPLPAAGSGEQPNPVICVGSRQTLEWSRALRDSVLWRHTSGDDEAHERIKDRLDELVRFVVESCQGTGAHHADPWADPYYPMRVENRLADLVDRAGLQGEERLSPAETAVLLATVVVHEGAVATALADLATVLPGQFDPGPRGQDATADSHGHRGLVRDAARDVCRAYALVMRTMETLHSRGFTEAATAADHWLRHRFIVDWDPLWERGSVYTTVHDLVGTAVAAVEAAADTPAAGPRSAEARQEIDRRIRQIVGHLTVKPGTSPRINDGLHADTWDDGDWRPVRGNQWRGRQLARLVWTAGLLAVDPRRLSSVLVDHLGARDPLRPRQVTESLGTGLDYDEEKGGTPDTRGLALRFDCPHPALHAALEELMSTADLTVRAFGQEAAAQPLLRGLPTRVTTSQLRALAGRYAQPLERFQLAEDEIRPLLMGTQLYGDRMLAVRELYQNALDACRVRDMRRQYGVATPWPGRIAFTQGVDGNRPYIQCEDNGAGMTRAKLTSMFARAGRRYEQDPEFVLERRNWRRAKLPHQPMNSRFGIGVFSYFMLADEVVVWTTAVDQHGRAGAERLRADIQSGSGLLQVNSTHDQEAPENGGTVVRLYLAEPRENEKRPSLLETLRSLLWVTEHEVTAQEVGEDGRALRGTSWKPGVLEPRDGWHGSPLRAGPDTWLVQGDGQILLDGVKVVHAPVVYGQVINLRERHSPVPSVDRNRILEYDGSLVRKELLDNVRQAVASVDEVSLGWLWELARQEPPVAVAVLDALPATTTAVLGSEDERRLGKERLRLQDVGCLPFDADVMSGTFRTVPLDQERPHESELYEGWQLTRLGVREKRESFTPDGYPRPAGLDAVLFQEGVPWLWHSVIQTAALADRSVREVLKALRRHAITGVRVPEAQDITALAGVRPTQAAADLYSAYSSMTEQIRSLTTDAFGPLRTYAKSDDELNSKRPPAVHAPLLAVSALHDLPLGRTAEMLGELRLIDPALPVPPELDPGLATEQSADIGRLVVHGPMHSPWGVTTTWLPGTVRPVDLLSRAEQGLPLRELVDYINRFAPLGLRVEKPPTREAEQAGALPPDQQLLLSASNDRTAPWHEGALGPQVLLNMSSELARPLGEVIQRINRATPITGVTAPHVPDTTANWTVPDWLVTDPRSRRTHMAFRPWEIVGSFHYRGRDIDELPRAVEALDAWGLIDWRGADADALIRQATNRHRLLVAAPDYASISAITYVSLSGDFDEDGLSLAYAFALTAEEETDLGTVMDQLTELHVDLPLRIEEPPPEARGLRATAIDVLVLAYDDEGPTRFRDHLTISDLLTHAQLSRRDLADSAARLSEFAVLGAPPPPGEGAAHDCGFEDLVGFVPDRFDHAAFDKGLLGPGLLGALELVLVAGRFGWTLGRTYRRYAPLGCLGLEVGVEPPVGGEEDLRPDWRDVVMLTEHLTGRAPALSGTVTREHIALCAEETDLDEAGVHQRLHRYARLFGLRLPDRSNREEARR
ncbi:HD domain-containing protein [Streptomyces ambofaciens]